VSSLFSFFEKQAQMMELSEAAEAMDDDAIEAIIVALRRLDCEEPPLRSHPSLDRALSAPRQTQKRSYDAAQRTYEVSGVLQERNTRLLRAALWVLGKSKSKGLLKRTIQVQAEGGMLTHDQSRKRSAGGLFFHLLRDEMDPDAYRKLMNDDKKKRKAYANNHKKKQHKKNEEEQA